MSCAARAVQEFLWKSPEANSESRWNVVTSLFGIAGQKRNTMQIDADFTKHILHVSTLNPIR